MGLCVQTPSASPHSVYFGTGKYGLGINGTSRHSDRTKSEQKREEFEFANAAKKINK